MNVRQKKALAALLQYPTHKAAAQACGLSERQLRTYLRDPLFRAEFDRLTAELLDEAVQAAKKSMTPAVCTLAEIAGNAEASDTARTAAARAILECALKMHVVGELDARLARLEKFAEVEDD